MAILIGSNIWRTLAEPIYVNGKVVKEVYANGIKVYPEGGNFIKCSGEVNFTLSHSHSRHDSWHTDSGPYGSLKEYWLDSGKNFNYRLRLKFIFTAIAHDGEITTERTTLNGRVNHDYSVIPFSEDSLRPDQISLPQIFYNGTRTGAVVVRRWERYLNIKVKYEMTPIPLCNPVSMRVYPLNKPAGGNPDHYIWTPSSDYLEWPTQCNNTVFSLDGGSSAASKVLCDDGMGCKLLFSDWASGSAWELSLRDTNFVWNKKIYEMVYEHGLPTGEEIYKSESEISSSWKDLSVAVIPITEVLYHGDYDTAPDWAKNIEDSELDFSL